jgi:two-component system chemotaxis sensor kinase CheA
LKAVEAGIFREEESRTLPTREIFASLFRPGFSTRTEVTELSGRGVGLDVVKSKVEHLSGGIELTSTPGAGTRFRLTLPLSVSILPVLTVEVGTNVVAFPVGAISSTVEVSPQDVHEQDGGQVLLANGGQVPVISLAQVLTLEGAHRGDRLPFVILQNPSGTVALAVDRFLREEDLYVKPLRGPLHRIPGVSGYSMLGDGRLVFLLDPATLLLGG